MTKEQLIDQEIEIALCNYNPADREGREACVRLIHAWHNRKHREQARKSAPYALRGQSDE